MDLHSKRQQYQGIGYGKICLLFRLKTTKLMLSCKTLNLPTDGKMLLQFAPAKLLKFPIFYAAHNQIENSFYQERMSENLEACTPISTIIRQCYNNHRISHIFVHLRKLPLQFSSCTHTHTIMDWHRTPRLLLLR